MSFEITIGSSLLTIFEWILECMGGKLTFKKIYTTSSPKCSFQIYICPTCHNSI